MRENLKRPSVIVAATVVVIAAIVVYRAFLAPTPTQHIERFLHGAAKAAEAKSILRLTGYFAANYRDASGLERPALLGYAQQFFSEASELKVKVSRVIHDDPKLSKDAKTAKAMVVLEISGVTQPGNQRFQGVAGSGGDAFLVSFARLGGTGDWQVVATQRLDASNPEALLNGLGKSK